ncbi:Ubiquitin carboxyl-terminal hydrolase 10 [Chamberlinius hualienensis]
MMDDRGNMNFSEPQLEFFNFDALSDDEVQRIKNLLKQPCSAVELPDVTIYAAGKDQVNGVPPDYKSVPVAMTVSLDYSHPVASTYATMPQPHMYSVASTVNGTAYITGYAVPNLYVPQPTRKAYVNGIDCVESGNGNAGTAAGAGALAEQVVDPNGVTGMVVPSNMYPPAAWSNVYQCPTYVLPTMSTFFAPITPVHATGIRAPTSTVGICGDNGVSSTVAPPLQPTYMAVAPVSIPPSVVAETAIIPQTPIPTEIVTSIEPQTYHTSDDFYEKSEEQYEPEADDEASYEEAKNSEESNDEEPKEEVKPSEPEIEKPDDVNGVAEVVVEISKPAPSVNKTWASLFKRKDTHETTLVQPPTLATNHQPKVFQNQGETPPTVVEKDKSAAVIVNGNNSSATTTQPKTKKMDAPSISIPNEHLQTNGFPKETNASSRSLGEMLISMKVDQKPVNFYPRGLQNKGNWCYINATLQALLACPPFYNFLSKLPNVVGLQNGNSSSPITDCMVEFVHEFSPLSHVGTTVSTATRKKDDKPSVMIGHHFEPSYIYSVMSKVKSDAFEGRQEDAEEFLSCLLNGLHEEMLAAIASAEGNEKKNDEQATENCDEDEESWKVIEKGNKSSVTRPTAFTSSPVSDIFCGRFRSALHAVSVSSATLQPFFSLPLDIQSDNVRSVKEALLGLVTKETLQGYHCSKTKQEVAASRQITLDELPPILILHLKRFVYDKDGGCQKLSKRLEFKINLEFGKELLSSTAKIKLGSNKQKHYRLTAVVYHCGREAVKGHYIADVYHHGSNAWLRADDTRLTVVQESEVLNHPNNMVPYLLFYRRLDEPLTNSVGSVK